MVKAFLLGLSLFYLLGDGEAGFNSKEERPLICNLCQKYVYETCLVNNGTCPTREENGCRTQIHYRVNKNKWLYSHTSMDCAKDCKRSYYRANMKVTFTFCCDNKDKCNWAYTPSSIV